MDYVFSLQRTTGVSGEAGASSSPTIWDFCRCWGISQLSTNLNMLPFRCREEKITLAKSRRDLSSPPALEAGLRFSLSWKLQVKPLDPILGVRRQEVK